MIYDINKNQTYRNQTDKKQVLADHPILRIFVFFKKTCLGEGLKGDRLFWHFKVCMPKYF